MGFPLVSQVWLLCLLFCWLCFDCDWRHVLNSFSFVPISLKTSIFSIRLYNLLCSYYFHALMFQELLILYNFVLKIRLYENFNNQCAIFLFFWKLCCPNSNIELIFVLLFHHNFWLFSKKKKKTAHFLFLSGYVHNMNLGVYRNEFVFVSLVPECLK